MAPGALGTLQKGGGRRPPPFARVALAPGAAQTPKMTECQSLNKSKIFNQTKVHPRRKALGTALVFFYLLGDFRGPPGSPGLTTIQTKQTTSRKKSMEQSRTGDLEVPQPIERFF